MSATQPADLSIVEAARLIRVGALSPVELTRACLDRIAARDPSLRAFITLMPEGALAAAHTAEEEIRRGEDRGPLHGIPLAVKDIIAMARVRTTAHSHALPDWTPDEDATVVTRLRQAGAVLLGKLALSEFATGSVHEGPFPAARNPWNQEHTPGHSSSGAGAAVAAQLCPGALGSDTGGSVRIPASYCGVVGLRPTYGRVSKAGVMPLAWSLDSVGPLTRTVADCALLMRAIAGPDPRDPSTAAEPVPNYLARLPADLTGQTIGVERRYFLGDLVEPATRAAVEAALVVLQDLGASVREVTLPALPLAQAINDTIHASESHAYHAPRLRTAPDGFGPTVRAYFRVGALIGAADYQRAQRARARFRREVLACLDTVDLLVGPTMPGPAGRLDAFSVADRFRRQTLTAPWSVAGLPAISLPCGWTDSGLPLGLQIAGRPFDEATVLATAHLYEQATEWHRRTPPEM